MNEKIMKFLKYVLVIIHLIGIIIQIKNINELFNSVYFNPISLIFYIFEFFLICIVIYGILKNKKTLFSFFFVVITFRILYNFFGLNSLMQIAGYIIGAVLYLAVNGYYLYMLVKIDKNQNQNDAEQSGNTILK